MRTCATCSAEFGEIGGGCCVEVVGPVRYSASEAQGEGQWALCWIEVVYPVRRLASEAQVGGPKKPWQVDAEN